MPVLEVRRHSIRKAGGGSQLSQAGVDLARGVGAGIGPFVRVVTSVVPRSRETAIAMGFAVDEELVTWVSDTAVYEELATINWADEPLPFVAIARQLGTGGAYKRYAHLVSALWRDFLTPLTGDDAVLFIGHSGELEAALVACFPAADQASWGQPFGPLEGARLFFSGEPAHFNRLELLRQPFAGVT